MATEEVVSWQLYAASAFGALYLWAVTDEQTRKIFGFAEIVEMMVSGERFQFFLTLLAFVFFGGIAVQLVLEPSTLAQAFTCGLGWSYFLSSSSRLRSDNANG